MFLPPNSQEFQIRRMEILSRKVLQSPMIQDAPSMTRTLTRDDCDFILKGAVVLACGGGGPLHFAREIIEEIDQDEFATIEPPTEVGDTDWMCMVALVGTPSKVHPRSNSPHKVRQRRMSPWNAAPLSTMISPLSSPRSSPVPGCLKSSKQLARSLDNLDSDVRPQSPRPTFYELVRHVMRVKFLSTLAPRFEEDIDAKTPCNAARNTWLYLQRQCQLRSHDYIHYPRFSSFRNFKYVLTGELGCVNMATSLYLSAVNKVKVIDCDGAGRSVPLVNQITYADNFSVSPTAIMSPNPGPDFDSIPSTILDFPQGSEKMVEEVAAALIADENGPFSPYIGYGSYVVSGEQMGDIPVYGSFTTALAVGKAIETFTGYQRAVAVSQVLRNHGRPNQIVFQGFVTEKVLQDSKVKDTGHLTVTNEHGEFMQLWYKNEIIMAGKPNKEPLFFAPDSICILPANSLPMDISTIPDPKDGDCLEVYILVIAADDKIKTTKVVQSFEKIYRVFKHASGREVYRGGYVEWIPEDSHRNMNNNYIDPPRIDNRVLSDDVIKVQVATPTVRSH